VLQRRRGICTLSRARKVFRTGLSRGEFVACWAVSMPRQALSLLPANVPRLHCSCPAVWGCRIRPLLNVSRAAAACERTDEVACRGGQVETRDAAELEVARGPSCGVRLEHRLERVVSPCGGRDGSRPRVSSRAVETRTWMRHVKGVSRVRGRLTCWVCVIHGSLVLGSGLPW
jgi:hypothetical protein